MDSNKNDLCLSVSAFPVAAYLPEGRIERLHTRQANWQLWNSCVSRLHNLL